MIERSTGRSGSRGLMKIKILLGALVFLTAGCFNQRWSEYDKEISAAERPAGAPDKPKILLESDQAPTVAGGYGMGQAQTVSEAREQARSNAPRSPTRLIASGQARLDPKLRIDLNSKWTLFVSIKEATSGSTIAAIKKDNPTFPVEFRLTDADSMRAEPIADELSLTVEARLDSDGDALSKNPALDASAKLDRNIKRGEENLILTLTR